MLSPPRRCADAPPASRAMPSHELASGIQSRGRSASACSVNPTAASSAAIPDLSLPGRPDARAADVARFGVVRLGEHRHHLGVLERGARRTVGAGLGARGLRRLVGGEHDRLGPRPGRALGRRASFRPRPASMAAVATAAHGEQHDGGSAIAIHIIRDDDDDPPRGADGGRVVLDPVSGASRIDGPPGSAAALIVSLAQRRVVLGVTMLCAPSRRWNSASR